MSVKWRSCKDTTQRHRVRWGKDMTKVEGVARHAARWPIWIKHQNTWRKVIRDQRRMLFGSGLTSFAIILGSHGKPQMAPIQSGTTFYNQETWHRPSPVFQVEPYIMDVNTALLKGLEGRNKRREVGSPGEDWKGWHWEFYRQSAKGCAKATSYKL